MKRLSPAAVTLVVVLIYLSAVLFRAQGDPMEFAQLGTRFSAGDTAGSEGYDGQFVYYIARDPTPATVAEHLDVPAYRYQRILLPLLARGAAFGDLDLLPWLIPVINLVAHLLAVSLLGRLLESWGINRWHALTYGLWVGFLLALRLDLPEPLAFSLVIAAIWFEHKKRSLVAWLCFGFALFAKETTLFFVAAQLLVYFSNRRWRDLFGLSLFTLLPLTIFQLWLWQQFGQIGLGLGGAGATGMEAIPFMGLWRVGGYSQTYMFALLIVYLPALFLPAFWALWVSVRRWLAGERHLSGPAAFLNAVVLPFLPFAVYREPNGTFRLTCGLVLAILLLAARFRFQRALNYSLFWLALNAFLLKEFLGG